MRYSTRLAIVTGCALVLMAACSNGPRQHREDILVQHMDTTVSPANDFFDYVNGGWIRKNPIPASESYWGIGNLVQNEIYTRLRKINEDAAMQADAPKDSPLQRIGDFWYTGMDSLAIEKQGIAPLKPELDRISAVSNRSGLLEEIAHLKTIGVGTSFGSYVGQDDKNSAMMALKLSQGGLGLPNRDYYLKKDERTEHIRQAYGQHIAAMFELLGEDSTAAHRQSDAVIGLETDLARASRKLEDLRDPYANYNKMSLRQLDELTPAIARPAISEQRLSLSARGRVRYQLKTPWRNGTTHVEWDPVDFIAQLAALVPPPRAHLTRFHGVFAPNAALRAQLTPAHRGKGNKAASDDAANPNDRTPDEKRRAMTWAQRLKRVFGIDVETCDHCGGKVRIVASVEEPHAIRAILAHFAQHDALESAHYRPAPRAPPAAA